MSFVPEDDRRLANLMRDAQSGDKQAYATLLRDIEKALKRFLTRRIKSTEAVEDVTQEILLSIHTVRHTYNCEKLFGPWMYAIARNRLADFWRRQFRLKENNEVDSSLNQVPEAEKAENELSGQMATALGELPESQRRVVELLKLQGFSIRETANALKMSEGAVKVSAHRAYEQLRKRFAAEAYTND